MEEEPIGMQEMHSAHVQQLVLPNTESCSFIAVNK